MLSSQFSEVNSFAVNKHKALHVLLLKHSVADVDELNSIEGAEHDCGTLSSLKIDVLILYMQIKDINTIYVKDGESSRAADVWSALPSHSPPSRR